MNIHAMPQEVYEKKHEVFLGKKFNYEELLAVLISECDMFEQLIIWPMVLRKKPESLDIRITVRRALAYNKSRPKTTTIMQFMLRGELLEMAQKAFVVMEFTKRVADNLNGLYVAAKEDLFEEAKQ